MAVRKTKAGLALKRWFKEDWKDQRTRKRKTKNPNIARGCGAVMSSRRKVRRRWKC